MSGNGKYTWDFDRPSAEWLRPYLAFSVGIFQWQKKTRGSEMKKSRAISRVMGYTADVERVYGKAVEICSRLNREAATAENVPSWLQKQYSVSRPAGLIVRRRSTDLTAAQVRAVRLKVMKERLLPAGFVVGTEASYVRRREDQIHFINFQGSRYGHKFTTGLRSSGNSGSALPPKIDMSCLPPTNRSLRVDRGHVAAGTKMTLDRPR